MFAIKTHAHVLMKGNTVRMLSMLLLPLTTLFCTAVAGIIAFMCLRVGADTAMSGWFLLSDFAANDAGAVTITVFFSAAAVFFAILTAGMLFYVKACFFYATDKNMLRPVAFISFGKCIKYLIKCFLVLIFKLLWLVLFLLPSVLCAFICFLIIIKTGVTVSVFRIMLVLTALLFASGTVFFTVTVKRYFLADYLLYLNPLLSAKEAVKASALAMNGRLLSVCAAKISLLPWRLSCLFVLPVPFAYSYVRFITALMCERLYGEKKCGKHSAAVTFLINSNSIFKEKATGGQQ